MAVGRVVKKDRLIRQQDVKRKRIPGAITPQDFLSINKILEVIFGDIDRELEALPAPPKDHDPDDHKPKELHIRLNESDKPWPLPIFVGWVESLDVQTKRQEWNHPHPGLQRFGDDIYSEIYGEAFRYANNSRSKWFRHRDWGNKEIPEILEKRSGEKATDPKAKNLFQTCLAIVIDGRAVGTLVIGFRRKPDEERLKKTQQILGEWARKPQSAKRNQLIKFLRKYELGGPRLKDSNWVDRI